MNSGMTSTMPEKWSLFWMDFRIHFFKFKKFVDAKFRVSKECISVYPVDAVSNGLRYKTFLNVDEKKSVD